MNQPSEVRVAAVDLGASSGRVLAGHGSAHELVLREVHRFPNTPITMDGVLRWDILALYEAILEGLRRAERELGGLDSIGIDSWAVDYGLLDADGQLLGNPVHYRDPRTADTFASVVESVGAHTLYAATGTQLQPFNTLFQLLADQKTAQFPLAANALLIPDLIVYWLTGIRGTELTNASTTGLLDPRTLNWSADLMSRFALPINLFPGIRRPGTVVGTIRADVSEAAGLTSRPVVITVPSHDTAAAVAGIAADADHFAYVCSGTWALVGLELTEPVMTDAARAANFTNEIGVDDTVRFLRNVTGFWLLQQSIKTWNAAGLHVDLDELTEAAAGLPSAGVIDVQEPSFAAADADMPALIRAACRRISQVELHSAAEITRCILDSIALAVRRALRDAARCTGHTPEVVHVVGGGVANSLFCQLIADACRLPVIAGPTEAAAWGNALSQAQALGVVAPGRREARAVIRKSDPTTTYVPRSNESIWRRLDSMLPEARTARGNVLKGG